MVGLDERQLKESPAWNHMKNVVNSLIVERPPNSVDVFESQSHFVLTGTALPAPTNTIYMDSRPRDKQLVGESVSSDLEWARNFGQQYAPPKAAPKIGEDGEEEPEPEEEEDKGELPDVVNEQRLFNSFGEGLPPAETFRLMVAMKRLLDKEPLAKIRFWGKITGIHEDYYICEAKIDESRVPEKENAEEEAGEEATGKAPETIYQGLNTYRAKEPVKIQAEQEKGVNEFKYYVANCTDPTKWECLPDVLPSHIQAARQIHKLFTGKLDAPVDCHPPFPGVERHLLRAQIARIAHATIVCPKDIYTTDAPEEEEEDEDGNKKPKRFEVKPYEEIPAQNPTEAPDAEDPEAVAPVKNWFYGFKNDELLQQKFWVHCVPQLLQEGRVTKFKPEEEEADPDGEEEEANAPQSTEWINPFLSDLSHDKEIAFKGHSKSSFPAWALRKAYHNASNSQRLYLAKSLRWPGACCYAECEDDKPGATYQNIYIGNGLQSRNGVVFVPPMPPLASAEFPAAVRLQKDCTRDDELEFEPAPTAPKVPGEEGEEDAEEE